MLRLLFYASFYVVVLCGIDKFFRNVFKYFLLSLVFMVIVQKGRLKKKPSGGRYKRSRSKRKYEIGRAPTHSKISEKQKTKTIRTKGGGKKTKVFEVKFANVLNQKDKTYSKVEIQSVVECPANRQFIRRNIIVKGSIISTKLGNARVTSRPGQSGTVNAVLVND